MQPIPQKRKLGYGRAEARLRLRPMLSDTKVGVPDLALLELSAF